MNQGIMQRISRLFGSWVFVALAATGFLVASARVYGVGFPLDDAWIHQTYARNLAALGEWAFIPGQPSAGSTAPLWSLALAFGYVLGLPPVVWAVLLGSLCLVVIACCGERIFRSRGGSASGIPWMGLFLALEWHLVWAALSGMETPLYTLLILAVFGGLCAPRPPWVWIGLAVGLSAWIRPDGITLLGPALFLVYWQAKGGRARLADGLRVLAGFALFFAPYLVFNQALAGSWWPNTFYAKQAEYVILQETPLVQRFFSLAGLPLVGAGVLLLPGFFYLAWKAGREKSWPLVAMLLWWLGYTLLYAMRLPVTYQHGRYLIPAMPVYFVLAGLGSAEILKVLRKDRRGQRMLRTAWLASIALVAVSFYGMGAVAYSQDVAIIQSEMVQTAQWVASHTQESDVIAVHDIGAMGYFSQRKLVDLAGLVSPEVIPFIRDETQLAQYLDHQQADYLVTFPGWYPQLTRGKTIVYQTGAVFAPRNGGENMCVYRWR